MLCFTNEYRLILHGLIIVLVVRWRSNMLLTRRPTGMARRWLRVTQAPEPTP
jgi:hypothetical protein